MPAKKKSRREKKIAKAKETAGMMEFQRTFPKDSKTRARTEKFKGRNTAIAKPGAEKGESAETIQRLDQHRQKRNAKNVRLGPFRPEAKKR